MVSAGIRDKAGVILNWLPNKGMGIGNKCIIDTCSFEEGFGNITFGEIDSVKANNRRPSMIYSIGLTQLAHR